MAEFSSANLAYMRWSLVLFCVQFAHALRLVHRAPPYLDRQLEYVARLLPCLRGS